MKAVILCGGQGTRIRDASELLPKPMLPIGGKPIVWHIMKIYARHGVREFVLCLGYKGWLIKEFFLNYRAMTTDVTVALGRHDGLEFHGRHDEEDWKVTLAETGEETMTGGRVAADPALRRAGRPLPAHLRRRRLRRRHRPRSSPSTASTARSRPSPRCARPAASARCAVERGEVTRVQREAAGDGGLHQRRLLRLRRQRDLGLPRHRPRAVLEREPLQQAGRATASSWRIPHTGLLAADGHRPRVRAPERALGRRQGALEDLVMGAPSQAELRRAYAGKRVLVTGHTGFKGSWLALWLARPRRRGDGLRARPAHDARRSSSVAGVARACRSVVARRPRRAAPARPCSPRPGPTSSSTSRRSRSCGVATRSRSRPSRPT